MIIYIDNYHRCHVENDDTMIPFETSYFIGKCKFYIEGYCCKLTENSVEYYPWKPYSELDAAQRSYERDALAQLAQSYVTGVNSI